MEKHALIVAHGQPSAPATAEAAISTHLPGWQVGSATLAAPGALARAVAHHGPSGVVFPLFMACGWFTGTHLPGQLAAVGGAGWRITLPFGCMPAIQELAVTLVREALTKDPGKTDVILAAHGSGRSPAPAMIATFVAARIKRDLGLRRAEAAFIDTICLPYFAAAGAHVLDDVPQALAAAGFTGRLLGALGTDRRTAAIIAAALQAQ
jgi:sirohydrochlorin ferrochelatase